VRKRRSWRVRFLRAVPIALGALGAHYGSLAVGADGKPDNPMFWVLFGGTALVTGFVADAIVARMDPAELR
jgi:hypothetical protein